MKEQILEVIRNGQRSSDYVFEQTQSFVSHYCVQLEEFFRNEMNEFLRSRRLYVDNDFMYQYMRFVYEQIQNNIQPFYSRENASYVEEFKNVCESTKTQINREKVNFDETAEELNKLSQKKIAQEPHHDMLEFMKRRFAHDGMENFMYEFIDEIKSRFMATKSRLDSEITNLRTVEARGIISKYDEVKNFEKYQEKGNVMMNEELDALASKLGYSREEISSTVRAFIPEAYHILDKFNDEVFSIMNPDANLEEKKEQADALKKICTEDFEKSFPLFCSNLSNDLVPKCVEAAKTTTSSNIMDDPRIVNDVNEFCRKNKISDSMNVFVNVQNYLCKKYNLRSVSNYDSPLASAFQRAYDMYRDAEKKHSRNAISNEVNQIQVVIDQNTLSDEKKSELNGKIY